MSKVDKVTKKEMKEAKKTAAAEKSLAKAQAKADAKHKKAYDKFVKDAQAKNAKGEAKGDGFTPIVIPSIDEFKTKAEIKAEKNMAKAYAATVKKIEKKNAKNEKKCTKKGVPFVPVVIPTEEEFAATAATENKGRKIALAIILILLIWFLIYFIIMYIGYEYIPRVTPEEETTTSQSAPNEYEAYSNPHEITTTPDYDVEDARRLLRQTIADNWSNIGYSKDPSAGNIAYTGKKQTINGANCYMFTCSGKSFGVSIKLSAVYYCHDGENTPLSFNNTNILFD